MNPEYNNLNIAIPIYEIKHSYATIKLMRREKLGNKHSEFAKLKIADYSAQAQCVLATYTKTRKSKKFTSIKAPRFIVCITIM